MKQTWHRHVPSGLLAQWLTNMAQTIAIRVDLAHAATSTVMTQLVSQGLRMSPLQSLAWQSQFPGGTTWRWLLAPQPLWQTYKTPPTSNNPWWKQKNTATNQTQHRKSATEMCMATLHLVLKGPFSSKTIFISNNIIHMNRYQYPGLRGPCWTSNAKKHDFQQQYQYQYQYKHQYFLWNMMYLSIFFTLF